MGVAFALLSATAGAAAVELDLAPWVEPDFPFFSSVVDARSATGDLARNNLTPRGLVLNLGGECWVGFDVDLLRVAAVWRGNGLTPDALAPGSYHNQTRKTQGGQMPAPRPQGRLWAVNGIYPGWQAGPRLVLEDPREPAPSPEEVGRGPLAEELGRFIAVHQVEAGAVLEYTVAGVSVREWIRRGEYEGQPVVERHFHVEPSTQPLWLAVGSTGQGNGGATAATVSLGLPPGRQTAELIRTGALWSVRVPPQAEPATFCVALAEATTPPPVVPCAIPTALPVRRWPQEVTGRIQLSTARDAYVLDEVTLPLANPWKRHVRISDIQFLRDGTGVGVTLDGDVWIVRGLSGASGEVSWRRFASGLHEPMTLAIRDEEIFVFDRNGIWRLRDTDGNGEADVHELFSNAFAQTADMREFPNTLRLAPGGEFVIAKGGQQATTLGKHNGSVLRISADGRRATALGYGFRQPNIGVNVRTGLVTASDQQGQYIPSTPLHIVRDGQFYGFLSDLEPREQYPAPIAEPLTWIPYAMNASGTSQIWLFGARWGPLNDSLVHIGFHRSELFGVLLNHRGPRPQAAVYSITRAFDFPLLNGGVNPADGQLYVAGFQVFNWGSVLPRVAGLARVRYTDAAVTFPREIVAMDRGLLLRFGVELDARAAVDVQRYTLSRWDYQRTYRYGSPQFKADGTPGRDWLPVSSAYLSLDRRSVFLGVRDMRPVMQMELGWSLATSAGEAFEKTACFTPYELPAFDPRAEGFGDLDVDLTPGTIAAPAASPVNLEEGQRVYQLFGCAACHSLEGADTAKIGPSWKGLFGRQRPLAGNQTVLVDEAYLRESILDPTAKVVAGFERGEYAMPSYAGVLTEEQIASLVLLIKSLH